MKRKTISPSFHKNTGVCVCVCAGVWVHACRLVRACVFACVGEGGGVCVWSVRIRIHIMVYDSACGSMKVRVNTSVYVYVSHTCSVTHTHAPTYANTGVYISKMMNVLMLDVGKCVCAYLCVWKFVRMCLVDILTFSLQLNLRLKLTAELTSENIYCVYTHTHTQTNTHTEDMLSISRWEYHMVRQDISTYCVSYLHTNVEHSEIYRWYIQAVYYVHTKEQ